MSAPAFEEALAAAEAALASMDLQALTEAGIYKTPLEYYLVGTYPPLKAMDPIEPDEVFSDASNLYNVYLHIPFCEQYCTFCHFYKEIQPGVSRVDTYVEALNREIELIAERLNHSIPASTVYFGGGTPSYLKPRQLELVFDQLWKNVQRSDATEVTFELHPGVVRQEDYEERLDVIRDSGVNRWVFGIQSMNEEVLASLNRGHGRQEVFTLLNLLVERGVDNLSVDLIYGLPYQTLENWHQTLTELVDIGLDKFNIFPLMFKRSDPITRKYMNDPSIFPDARERLLMHFMTEYVLGEEGFKRGPLLYYAKSNTHSRQQQGKFDSIESENLLPFGVSGFGYVGGTQYYNVCDLDDYVNRVSAGVPSVWRGLSLSNDERARRALMFGIRSGGVRPQAVQDAFGVDVRSQFAGEWQQLRELGLIDDDGELITLTDMGAVHSEGIALKFVSEAILRRVNETNLQIRRPSKDPLDRYDYSPIGRVDAAGGVAS